MACLPRVSLYSASLSPSGREALIPAETEHGEEGPSTEETLSSTGPLLTPASWPATEGGHRSSLLLEVGHDAALCYMHMAPGFPLMYFAIHVHLPTRCEASALGFVLGG